MVVLMLPQMAGATDIHAPIPQVPADLHSAVLHGHQGPRVDMGRVAGVGAALWVAKAIVLPVWIVWQLMLAHPVG